MFTFVYIVIYSCLHSLSMVSIDVIIPSFRLQSEYLLSLIKMEQPPDTVVRYLIIADNPKASIPQALLPYIDGKKVILFRNPANLGSSGSRNKGIDNSIAEWILFLDDDVKPDKDLLFTYLRAIKDHPKEVGFFGKVLFPEPINNFTKGIVASGLPKMYSIADDFEYMRWYPTANVMIKRSAIGNTRFNEIFPKNGAGEEIEFFLSIHKNTGQDLKGVKKAIVHHNWWNNGKRDYTRFFRYLYGGALLSDFFPEYSFYNYPNVIESLFLGLFLGLVLWLILHSALPMFCIFAGVITGECVVDFIRILKTRGFGRSIFVMEVFLIKAANDLGTLARVLKDLRIPYGFCRRFDIFCNQNTARTNYFRYWARLKFAAYLMSSFALYFLFTWLKK